MIKILKDILRVGGIHNLKSRVQGSSVCYFLLTLLQLGWKSKWLWFTQGSVVLKHVDTFGFCLHRFFCSLLHLCLFHFLLSLGRFNKDLFILWGRRSRGLCTLQKEKDKLKQTGQQKRRVGLSSCLWYGTQLSQPLTSTVVSGAADLTSFSPSPLSSSLRLFSSIFIPSSATNRKQLIRKKVL